MDSVRSQRAKDYLRTVAEIGRSGARVVRADPWPTTVGELQKIKTTLKQYVSEVEAHDRELRNWMIKAVTSINVQLTADPCTVPKLIDAPQPPPIPASLQPYEGHARTMQRAVGDDEALDSDDSRDELVFNAMIRETSKSWAVIVAGWQATLNHVSDLASEAWKKTPEFLVNELERFVLIEKRNGGPSEPQRDVLKKLIVCDCRLSISEAATAAGTDPAEESVRKWSIELSRSWKPPVSNAVFYWMMVT